jgi:hypothetical protein
VSSRTPLSSVSSGFRTILALTCDVMRWLIEREKGFTTLDAARGLFLIDEVEAHLHPRWKVTSMDGLRPRTGSMMSRCARRSRRARGSLRSRLKIPSTSASSGRCPCRSAMQS